MKEESQEQQPEEYLEILNQRAWIVLDVQPEAESNSKKREKYNILLSNAFTQPSAVSSLTKNWLTQLHDGCEIHWIKFSICTCPALPHIMSTSKINQWGPFSLSNWQIPISSTASWASPHQTGKCPVSWRPGRVSASGWAKLQQAPKPPHQF